MELNIDGAWIGVNRERIFIRAKSGETVSIALEHAEALVNGLRDAIQTADMLTLSEHAEKPFGSGMLQDIRNLIDVCDRVSNPAA